MTFDEAPLVIPDSAIKRILADLGAPILNAKEDLCIDDSMIKELFITPAIQMYFTYWPLKLKEEYPINGQTDIPFPNDQVFGVSETRVALLQQTAQYGGNPFINEVIRRQTSSFNSYGRTPSNRDPYITPGILIKEQTEQLSYITLRKAGNFNLDLAKRRLWGFSNVAGNLIIDWAMWSKNWADIRFEHIEDVIKVCKMYALEFVGGIRQQSDPNTGVTADGSSFLDKAAKIQEEIVEGRWRGRIPVVLLT
jgi:hypothetical protein